MSKRATKAQAAEERVRLAFRRFWEAKATGEDQRIVLENIAHFCGWDKDPYQHGNANHQNYNLGAHRVFLFIQRLAGVTSPLGRSAGEWRSEEPEDLRKGRVSLTGESDG